MVPSTKFYNAKQSAIGVPVPFFCVCSVLCGGGVVINVVGEEVGYPNKPD